ncbi:MAG: fumarate hydratase [Euryarchaeota archaeon]|nr:fumarate hydratase [Euryarchaeota archaeon]
MIPDKVIEDTVVEILRLAVTKLPADVEAALRRIYEEEKEPASKMQMQAILENLKLAEETGTPLCQDTGIHVFFVRLGAGCGDIEGLIRKGVERATKEVPLRPNAVHPVTRRNPGQNLGVHMPYIYYEPGSGGCLEITVMPKGAGSENMSQLAMLTPSAGVKGIKEFALNTLLRAGSNPCPPILIGMGIGGSADICMGLAKKALLRPVGSSNPDPDLARLERELFEALNGIGIGPMGLGGKNTLLGFHIEHAFCHTASHPVAVNIQCWAARKATARIFPDGRVEYLTHDVKAGRQQGSRAAGKKGGR